MIFILGFIASFALSVIAVRLVRSLAIHNGVLDIPKPEVPRKIHKATTPLMGGIAVILAFDVVSAGFYFFHPLLNSNIPLSSMLAIWVGSIILAVGGVWDDIKSLPPIKLFLAPLLAVLVVLVSGMNIPHITNPLSGFGLSGLPGPEGKIELVGPVIAGVGVVSAAFVLMWLLGMIYTTKFLDGLDGLASSIGIVGALSIFALSFTPNVQQDYTAMLAVILMGALSGFLVFNWHPANIFLGESGSTFIGFALGILAIIAGGKIATAFLVMGVPILDVAWVIGARLAAGRSPFKADKSHLHFRLLSLGLTQPQIVSILVMFSLLFGGLAVVLQSLGKLILLLTLFCVMLLFGFAVVTLNRRKAAKDIGA